MIRHTVLRDFAVLSSGQVVGKVVGFFVFASLARTLGPEGYGTAEYVIGLALFFQMLVESGLGPVGVRRIVQQPASLPALAAQVPLARLGLALIAVPLMLMVATPTAQGPAARGLLWLFAVSLLAVPWRQDWLMQATGRMGEAALAQALRVIVFAAVVFAFVRRPADILVVGWAEIAAGCAMSLYCLAVQQARITPYRLRAPVAGLSGLAKEGGLVGLASVVWAANQYAPLLLVATVMGGEETAWFAAASRLVTSLLVFSNLYYFNLYPAIARATATDRDDLANLLAASFRLVAWGGILVALALTVLAEPLCLVVFGSRFGPAGSIVKIMAWMLPVTLLSGHARWALVATGSQSRVVYTQAAGSLAIPTLGLPLVLLLGGRGAAGASLVVSLVVWAAAHAFSVRHGVKLPALGIALAPAALAAVVIAASHVLGLHSWTAGLAVLAFAAAAPLVDRRLWPDLGRLSTMRIDKSVVPEEFPG